MHFHILINEMILERNLRNVTMAVIL